MPNALIGSIAFSSPHSERCSYACGRPYALKSDLERDQRHTLLTQPHMAPLTVWIDSLRRRLAPSSPSHIPYIDPCDGGIQAEVLFLLEAPGPKAIASGFISRNNPDQTARNMCLLLQEAGLPRHRTLLWNVVPWYIGADGRIRAATNADLNSAGHVLNELVNLLPRLQSIVLVGRKAQQGFVAAASCPQRVRITRTWHPSPRVLNRWPVRRSEILGAFRSC